MVRGTCTVWTGAQGTTVWLLGVPMAPWRFGTAGDCAPRMMPSTLSSCTGKLWWGWNGARISRYDTSLSDVAWLACWTTASLMWIAVMSGTFGRLDTSRMTVFCAVSRIGGEVSCHKVRVILVRNILPVQWILFCENALGHEWMHPFGFPQLSPLWVPIALLFLLCFLASLVLMFSFATLIVSNLLNS